PLVVFSGQIQTGSSLVCGGLRLLKRGLRLMNAVIGAFSEELNLRPSLLDRSIALFQCCFPFLHLVSRSFNFAPGLLHTRFDLLRGEFGYQVTLLYEISLSHRYAQYSPGKPRAQCNLGSSDLSAAFQLIGAGCLSQESKI